MGNHAFNMFRIVAMKDGVRTSFDVNSASGLISFVSTKLDALLESKGINGRVIEVKVLASIGNA